MFGGMGFNPIPNISLGDMENTLDLELEAELDKMLENNEPKQSDNTPNKNRVIQQFKLSIQDNSSTEENKALDAEDSDSDEDLGDFGNLDDDLDIEGLDDLDIEEDAEGEDTEGEEDIEEYEKEEDIDIDIEGLDDLDLDDTDSFEPNIEIKPTETIQESKPENTGLQDSDFGDLESLEDDGEEDLDFEGLDESDFGDLGDIDISESDTEKTEEEAKQEDISDSDLDIEGLEDIDIDDREDNYVEPVINQPIKQTQPIQTPVQQPTQTQQIQQNDRLARIRQLEEEARLAELEAELIRKKREAEQKKIEEEKRLAELKRSANSTVDKVVNQSKKPENTESKKLTTDNKAQLEKREKIKQLLREKQIRESQQKKVKEQSKYMQYDVLDIDALYSEVRKFLKSNNIEKGIIDTSVLEEKFGKQNIKKLILKSYLIAIRKGVTIGK